MISTRVFDEPCIDSLCPFCNEELSVIKINSDEFDGSISVNGLHHACHVELNRLQDAMLT